MTTPFITMLDRGNSIGIGIGLVSWSAVAYRSRRWLWCGIFLAVGSAFTVFPVLLLVIPLALRRYRFATFVFSCAVLLNLLALLCIPGGYIENFRTVVPAMSSGALASGSLLTTWSLYSLVPKMADLLLGPSHIGHLLDPSRFWSWLPAVLYLVLVFLIIRFRRVPQWCWGALSLGSIQLVLPFSAAYTTGWACLAAIWFARGSLMNMELCHSDERPAFHDDMILRVIVLLALVVTLVPSSISIAGVGGSSVLATYLLSPALLLATLCLAAGENCSSADGTRKESRPGRLLAVTADTARQVTLVSADRALCKRAEGPGADGARPGWLRKVAGAQRRAAPAGACLALRCVPAHSLLATPLIPFIG